MSHPVPSRSVIGGALVLLFLGAGCPSSTDTSTDSGTTASGSTGTETTGTETTGAETTGTAETSQGTSSGPDSTDGSTSSPTSGGGDTETTGTTSSPSACGDDVQAVDEECDLGPANADAGACTSACKIAFCGDGLLHAGVELCDDGDDDPNDGCDLCGVDFELPPRPRLVGGLTHTCALSPAGSVRCWGGADAMIGHGQIGSGDLEAIGDQPGEMPPPDVAVGGPVAQIAAGTWHTCAVLKDGSVRCWGKGDAGQLGLGASESIGDEPGEMPPPPIDLDGPAVQVAPGGGWEGHTCALMVDGAVRCWGASSHGQLGIDTSDPFVGDAPGEMPPAIVPLPARAVLVVTAERSSCALLASGGVMCWGGSPDKLPPTHVAVGGVAIDLAGAGDGYCAHLAGGTVRCWGRNLFGELGYGHTSPVASPAAGGDLDLGATAERIARGSTHACAIVDGGVLRCWGNNSAGQLGLGHTDILGDQPGEMPTPAIDLGAPVVEVMVGGDRTCAQLASASYFCWGWNGGGDLGLGHTMTIGDEPGEMPPPATPVF